MDKKELREAQQDLENIMEKVQKEIAEERARSPDGKTDIERKLSHMSVEDCFMDYWNVKKEAPE